MGWGDGGGGGGGELGSADTNSPELSLLPEVRSAWEK